MRLVRLVRLVTGSVPPKSPRVERTGRAMAKERQLKEECRAARLPVVG
jgi:hypothetical protein